MLYCKWCVNKVEAIAILPMPGGSRRPDIPICSEHKYWVEGKCWGLITNLQGTPLNREEMDNRINQKHREIRGSDELKFKPRDPFDGELLERTIGGI